MATHSSILAWRSCPSCPWDHGQRSLVGYSPWGRKESKGNSCTNSSFFPIITFYISDILYRFILFSFFLK